MHHSKKLRPSRQCLWRWGPLCSAPTWVRQMQSDKVPTSSRQQTCSVTPFPQKNIRTIWTREKTQFLKDLFIRANAANVCNCCRTTIVKDATCVTVAKIVRPCLKIWRCSQMSKWWGFKCTNYIKLKASCSQMRVVITIRNKSGVNKFFVVKTNWWDDMHTFNIFNKNNAETMAAWELHLPTVASI
jgi:hypothetical protein